MALQGDLKSFALPDVLRLLAGTGKSGHLEVVGDGRTGEVVLASGAISSGRVSSSPHATDPAEVIFDLLRFEDGSFTFDESDVADAGAQADVDATIAAAEQLVIEWTDVETVVPSMDAWISLAAEIDGDTVTLTAGEWRALASIGGGGNVHDLAAALELTDLDACRQVKGLVEADLVEVRESHGYVAPTVELDDFEQFEQFEAPASAALTDFEDLNGDERSVVMEDREDALLPEPLPGEGVAYEGESITGVVDGRSFDPIDGPDHHGDLDDGSGFAAFESLASFEEEAAMSDLAGEPGTFDDFGAVNPYSAVDPTDPAYQHEAEVEPEPVAQAEPAMADEPVAEEEGDTERGSLLKFLSTVKP